MIPHSFASPELLAHVAYEKYCNGMPLYRQEKDFKGHDVILSRATMANWIIYAAKEWLAELYDKMKEELLAGKVIHADETVVQVLHEEGRKAKTRIRGCGYTVPEKSDVNQISCLNISRHAEENMQRNFWEATQEHLYVTDMILHTTV